MLSDRPEYDGVVIDYRSFGNTGTTYATVNMGDYAPYNLGRTATHEIGHWMNLYHIWGDDDFCTDKCIGTDFVADTPNQRDQVFGCPGNIASCEIGKNAMTMNYMDYTDDACMNAFTTEQKNRMRANFSSGQPRASFQKQEIYIQGTTQLGDIVQNGNSSSVVFNDKAYTISAGRASGYSTVWEVSSGITIVSQGNSGITIRGNAGNAGGWLRATLQNAGACGNVNIYTIQHDITIDPLANNNTTCPTGNFNGSFDGADCNNMFGWCFENGNLGRTVQVDILVDGVKVATVDANQNRPDLGVAFSNSAAIPHGFSYSVPSNASWRNGQNRTVIARPCGGTNDLGVKTVNCTGGTGGGTPTPTGCGSGTGLTANYFAGEELQGNPIQTLTQATVNIAGGDYQIIAGTSVAGHNVSARWEGQVEAPVSGSYTFNVRTDDGTRVWFDGGQVVNDWGYFAPTDHNFTVSMNAGDKKNIKIEWKQAGGGYEAGFYWTYPNQGSQIVPACRLYPTGGTTGGGGTPTPTGCGSGTGLTANYFAGQELQGNPVQTLTQATVNIAGGDYQIIAGTSVAGNNVSARWEGQVEAPVSGSYTFNVRTDDGTRVWFDGGQVVNDWGYFAPTDHNFTVSMNAGDKKSIKIEWKQAGGGYEAGFYWTYPNQGSQIVPACRLYPTGGTTGGGTVTPPTNCAGGNFNGHLDGVNCSAVFGWCFENNNLGRTVQVDIFVDDVKVGTVDANQNRSDLGTAFQNPAAIPHGYTYSIPQNAAWKNGQPHNIRARPCGGTNDLANSPKSLNCNAGQSRVAVVLEENTESISVYPNPTTGKIKVVFVLQKEESVWLNLYDAQGKSLNIKDFEGKVGRNEVEYELDNHPTGAYFVDFQSAGKREILKVIKVN